MRDGKTSIAFAREHYGVVVDEATLEIDRAQTERLRAQLMKEAPASPERLQPVQPPGA